MSRELKFLFEAVIQTDWVFKSFHKPKNFEKVITRPACYGQQILSPFNFKYKLKENDNETYGEGNAYDFGARIYDARLGKWMSVDPSEMKYPGISPYNYSLNTPILLNDPDGADFRLTTSINENGMKVITIETTVHLYGPDAEELSKQISGFSSSGIVNLNGEPCMLVINVNYVVNKQLDQVTTGKNDRYEQYPPDASKYAEQGVKKGDNIMYVNKNFGKGNGQTHVGYNSGRMKRLSKTTLIHESLHFLGYGERYCLLTIPGTDGNEIVFNSGIDQGFKNDYLSNNPNDDERNQFNPIHLYDMAVYASKQVDGVKNGAYVDDVGEVTCDEHKPQDPIQVERNSKLVSKQVTTVTP